MAYDIAVLLAQDWSISFDKIVCIIKDNLNGYGIIFEECMDNNCDAIISFFGGEKI